MKTGRPTTRLIGSLLGASLLVALFHAPPPTYAAGSTRFVSPNGVDNVGGFCLSKNHPCRTFGFALFEAVSGDTIRGTAGDYPAEQLFIFKDVTIIGAGKGQTRINGAGSVRVVFVNKGATVTLSQLSILNGLGADGGGGIRNEGTLTLDRTHIWGNSAFLDGGGVWNGGTLTVKSSAIEFNTAIGSAGGAISNQGTLVLKQSSLVGNNARWGGGLANYSPGTVTLTDGSIGSNSAEFQGGGIAVFGGRVTLTRVTLSVNTAGDVGGALYNAARSVLEDVAILNNRATGQHGSGDGAGVANTGSISLSRVSLDTNLASGRGGAFNNDNDGQATLTNVTLHNNSAALASGIMNGYTDIASTALTNVTVFGDSYTGTGIYMVNGEVTLKNTIVGNGSTAACVGYLIVSLGHNIGDRGCGLDAAKHDLIEVDPKVGPYGDWGGFTNTYRLTAKSPAIDAGTNTGCPSTDQRGVARPVDGDGNGSKVCDIGAYEYKPPTN